jgi:hypothetical protein
MCEPISAAIGAVGSLFTPGVLAGAQTGLGLLNTGLQFAAGKGQAKTARQNAMLSYAQQQLQYEAQERANALNKTSAEIAGTIDSTALDLRFLQQWEGVSAQAQSFANEADKATGMVRAKVSDSGLSGNSIDAIINDLAGQEANRQLTLGRNMEAVKAQTQVQKAGIEMNKLARIANIAPAQLPVYQFPNQGPSTASLLLNVGSNLLGGLRTYNKLSNEE